MLNGILNTFLGGFSNWKTSLAGVVGFVAMLLHTYYGFNVTPVQQGVVVAFVLLVYGWISKDATVTGTPDDHFSE